MGKAKRQNPKTGDQLQGPGTHNLYCKFNVILTLRVYKMEPNGPICALSELQTHKDPFGFQLSFSWVPPGTLSGRVPRGPRTPLWEPLLAKCQK